MKNQTWILIVAGVLIMLNGVYLALEMYRGHVREEWSNNENLAGEAFNRLSSLGNWTSAIEVAVTAIVLVTAVWILKKRQSLLRAFTYANIAVLVVFLLIGFLVASIYPVAVGNAVQQLVGPGVIVMGLVVYQIVYTVRTATR
ncbi:hypothetical protein FLK61_41415 [Paenalkalicoccus suaedae]|uniref:Uncharacterized protein n=1 Tax=Paenalkalicoccus suaedae TaxID=2592382 RepID=A0A859FJT0_9BACI|nr:hypothetical protein [Paenalkalicoccus suaedae]QKS73053.1 hypothetical protein FLK61_41415 [Paenalkalicoccus suaedae]